LHILFLTDNFPPEVNAPASRTYEHCREWVKSGHKVTVITGVPNFPKGKVFPGYKNLIWQSEVMDGIHVIRVWTFIAENVGFCKRILDYISFMISATLAACFVKRVDIIIGTSPQLFTVCAAWIVSCFKRAPWVFELRDIWPESIKAVGAMKESFILRALERLTVFLYTKANLIVVVTHSFRKTLVELGINKNKIVVVTNGVDLTRFKPQTKNIALTLQVKIEGKFVVGYVGTHGMAHHLETLIDAAEILQKESSESGIHFLFLGDGAQKENLINRAKGRGIINTTFLDSVSKDLVSQYWSLVDVAVIHLRRNPLFSQVIPSKLFECMGMGIPVLHGVMGESAKIVELEQMGEVFEPENARALANRILQLRNDNERHGIYRNNCLRAANHYDRTYLANTMLTYMAGIKKC
jgi:glycosyltransferase involved in cell wall biosynthesis